MRSQTTCSLSSRKKAKPYGMIAMTCARVSELSVVDTYYWPDYDTFEKAKNEYALAIVQQIATRAPKSISRKSYVYRAWFDGTDDMKSLSNF